MVSVFPAVEFGQLHYRNLELQKIYALRMSHGDFNAKTKVTEAMKLQLKWWFDYIKDQYRIINHGNPDKIITTDASTHGWGSVFMSFKIGGRWNETESKQHINYLELLAAFYGLRAFCKDDEGIHVGLKMDNTCAIAYLNNMGGIRSKVCNELATNIWLWCIQRGIWLSASYVHTSQNVADIESRKFNENIEWKLNSNVFRIVTEKLGVPNFDLFASRLNTQLPTYASWKPGPGCKVVDAFSFLWTENFYYAFPPFSLLGRMVQKIRRDQSMCLVIAPIWPTQSWYTDLLQILIDNPIILPTRRTLLTILIKSTNKVHPLWDKMKLMACLVSGNLMKVETFLQRQPVSLWHPGDLGQRDNIPFTSENGLVTVVKGKLITFKVL